MLTDFMFYVTAIGLGVGLAMDAFSVSLTNGLNEPRMKIGKTCGIAGMFAFFQALMPFLGWVILKVLERIFAPIIALIPWIAFALLGFIGGKMLYEGIKNKDDPETDHVGVGFGALLVQGIATSIDALSAGTSFSSENPIPGAEPILYTWSEALIAAIIIALVTFIICVLGVEIGKKTGTKLAGKAGILGGSILILVGLWIFISSFLGI